MIKAFLKFGWIQVLCCIFPACIFLILGLSKILPLTLLARYDFILVMCLLVQVGMVVFKLETKDELKVICLFHLIGLVLEIFKVQMGSWSYPEESFAKLAGGPPLQRLYVCQCCQLYLPSLEKIQSIHDTLAFFSLDMADSRSNLPQFSHHFMGDMRWVITAALFIVFGKTFVSFEVLQKTYKMPMVLAYFLIGFFIWVAENISTFLGAWQYPNQEQQWELVHLGKISSWFLLVIISVIIVVNLKYIKESLPRETVLSEEKLQGNQASAE